MKKSANLGFGFGIGPKRGFGHTLPQWDMDGK